MPRSRNVITLLCIALLLGTSTLIAAPLPSRSTADSERQIVRSTVEQEQVAARLSEMGYSHERVEQAVARLSDRDIHQLATHIQQLQPAGGTVRRTWITAAMLAVFVVAVVAATRDNNKSSYMAK